MKNRALLLLLKNGYKTIKDYADLIRTDELTALAIIQEKLDPIPMELIERSCDAFKVSMDYFLCYVE